MEDISLYTKSSEAIAVALEFPCSSQTFNVCVFSRKKKENNTGLKPNESE